VTAERRAGTEHRARDRDEGERADDTDAGDEERRAADPAEVRRLELEPDVEEEQHHPELAAGVDEGIGAERSEKDARERGERDARAELPDDAREPRPRREAPAEVGDDDEEREGAEERRNRHRRRHPSGKSEGCAHASIEATTVGSGISRGKRKRPRARVSVRSREASAA
jgi:hypothetical protein